jgi:peroxin-2
LDEELLGLLKTQVGDALKYLGPHLQDDWSQEILLALRAVLFKLSIWDNDASYGAALQNLRYADARKQSLALPKPTRWQKSLYGLITVFGRYGWDKWEDWLIDQERGYTAPSEFVQRLMRLTSFASTTHSIAAFCSFLVFLVNGRYRTLTDRLLRLRLASPSNQVSREVSFEYLNRQLVWHAFTEFLLFLLPLVGISRWRRWLVRAWKRTKDAMKTENTEDDEDKAKTGPLAFLPERTCAICYQDQNPTSTSEAEILGANSAAGGGVIGSANTDIVNPYETVQCNCIYCFVCITTKIEAEEGSGWTCLRCGEIVYKCRPWNGDVVVEQEKKVSSKSAKSVGFSVSNDELDEDSPDKSSEGNPEMIDSTLASSQWTMADEDTQGD